MSAVIQGLWVGQSLSTMEVLSIQSFLSNGHAYHLYVYDHLNGVPPGVVLKDGNSILDADKIFRYTEHDSYAGFANSFRYKLLMEKGGWWADLDTICLLPFEFNTEYVFSSEYDQSGAQVANAGVIKSLPGSAFASYASDVCQSKKPLSLKWGETGPRLVQEAISRFSLQEYIQSAATFCPISYWSWGESFGSGATLAL